jgi:uncharacterized protein (TIGR02996 family)
VVVTMTANTTALELAAFDNPDDADAWAVYADWLTSVGEPLGELISLELQIEAAVAMRRPISPALASRYAELSSGPARRADGPLAKLLATPDATRSLALEWRRGHPYLARIATDSLRLTNELLAGLMATRGPTLLNSLSVTFSAQHDETGALEFTGGSTASRLRALDIDGWTFSRSARPLADLTLDLADTWPRLESLRIRCPHVRLAALAHSRLRNLTISLRRAFDPDPIQHLASARLPALEDLQLFLGASEHEHDNTHALLLGVIDNPLLGGPDGLRVLGLCAAQLSPSFLAALADTKLIRSLAQLRLAWGTIGDEHLPALRALISNAGALERLDLTRNYLSTDAVAELRTLLGPRLIAGDQKPDGDRQIPVFGRYGFDDSVFDD